MRKDGEKMAETKNRFLMVIYAISIMIVFVAFAQVSIRTFIDYKLEYPSYNCSYYGPIDVKGPVAENMTAEQKACEENFRAVEKTFQDNLKVENKWRFIASIAISLLTLLLISLFKLKNSVHYGFFAGLVLNILFSMQYIENSYTIVGILLVLLIILVYYINKRNDE